MSKRPNTFEDPLVLEAALEGLQLQRTRIDAQISEIRSRLGKRPRAATETVLPAKRNLSAEARKRIATAQKKRWAEYRKTNANSR